MSNRVSPFPHRCWLVSQKKRDMHPSGTCRLPTKNYKKTLSRGQFHNVAYTPHEETTCASNNIPAEQHHRVGFRRRINRNGPGASSESEKLILLGRLFSILVRYATPRPRHKTSSRVQIFFMGVTGAMCTACSSGHRYRYVGGWCRHATFYSYLKIRSTLLSPGLPYK